ncbi:MAG: hypothetical protein HY645_01895 [Acidobacteria bacterium]|nr:hypothetical protein [Acidobacteriota bacterium]
MMKLKTVCVLMLAALPVLAGVRKEIETSYIQRYKNRAMFLKIPVRGLRQTLHVTGSGVGVDNSNIADPLAFKVGDQIRITGVAFEDDYIRFNVSSIDLNRESQLIFKFATRLDENFSQSRTFDTALAGAFTEGLHYADVETAREKFIKDQYDQLIEQFSSTTGADKEFVIKAISEKNPEYVAARREAAESKARLQEMTKETDRLSNDRRRLESQLQQLRIETGQNKETLQQLREEQQRLSNQRGNLERQIAQLQRRNRDYELQTNELLKKMGVKTAEAGDLGKQVEALSSGIESLRSDRQGLSQKLQQLGKELEQLNKKNELLSAELKQAQALNERLNSDFKNLTSNRDSLAGRYTETRNRKEILERAILLDQSLSWEKRWERREDGDYLLADLLMNQRKIGILEVKVPETAGRIYTVGFSMHSPDIVEFSEEERKLYATLGSGAVAMAAWSGAPGFEATLLKTPGEQSIAPRSPMQWEWLLGGNLSSRQPISLHLQLINSEEQKIFLDPLEFTLRPSGFQAWVQDKFSLVSFAGGALLVTLAGLVGLGFFKRSRTSAGYASTGREDYVVPKKL